MMDLKRLKSKFEKMDIKDYKAFIVGFCGGDCAGKKEMINYLFEER